MRRCAAQHRADYLIENRERERARSSLLLFHKIHILIQSAKARVSVCVCVMCERTTARNARCWMVCGKRLIQLKPPSRRQLLLLRLPPSFVVLLLWCWCAAPSLININSFIIAPCIYSVEVEYRCIAFASRVVFRGISPPRVVVFTYNWCAVCELNKYLN